MAVKTPTITNFFADSGTRGDGITDANVITLWGTAPANTTVTVYDGTTRLGVTTADNSGSWTFETPKLSDSGHSLTATATDVSGSTSVASPAMPVTVAPSVTHFVTGTDNWSNPTIIDGQGWYNENAGKSWSLTEPDSHTVRMEVRAGDYWVEDGSSSSRSEILAANSVSKGQIFNASYTMTVEPGTSNVNSGLSWLSLAQMYGANGATFSIQLQGEKMAVVVNMNQPTQKQVYTDPNPIQRGEAYDIQIQARFATDSTGYLEIWRNGVEIVDYHGVLGDSGNNYNLKLGIYRGDPSAANYTMAADYSNIVTSTDPAYPTPPFSGSAPAVISPKITSFSNDSNVAGDGITNDNTPALTGTAAANDAIKVYDGAILLGSTTANASGAWSFTTGVLADGKHSLSAIDVASDGSISASSPLLSLTVDTAPPAAPVISSTFPKTGQPSVLTLTGSAEANTQVKVFDGTTLLGSVAASGSGAWSFTTANLSNATHRFTATAMDVAGNTSLASSVFSALVNSQTAGPIVSSVSTSGAGITAGTGDLTTGDLVTFVLKLNETVTVGGGTPTLKLNDGGIATYTGGSGTDALTFSYKVAAGQKTSDLAVTTVNLNSATVKDGAGNAANLSAAVANPAGVLSVNDATRTSTNFPHHGHYSLASVTESGRGHSGAALSNTSLAPNQSNSLPSESSSNHSVSALDRTLALWTQHMAAAFPTSGFSNNSPSLSGHSDLGGGPLSQLAQSIQSQRHG